MKSLSNIIKNNPGAMESFFEEDAFYPRLNNAEQSIQEAKKKALEIVQDAEAQAGSVLVKFQEEGIRKGLQEVSPLNELLTNVIAELKKFKEQAIQELEPIVVNLAFKIAQKVIKEEIQTNPEIIKKNVKKMLGMMIDKEAVVLQLNPEDLQLMKEHQKQIIKSFRDIQNLQLEANPSILRGGCYIKSERGELDGTLETQFSEVAKEVGLKKTIHD